MNERLTFGDVVACSGLGAMAGGFLFSIGFTITRLFEVGPVDGLGTAVLLIPISILVAIFTAWPIGIVFGALVAKFFGAGYPQACLAGTITGLVFGSIFGLPLLDPKSVQLLISFASIGCAAGASAWWKFQRTAKFGT